MAAGSTRHGFPNRFSYLAATRSRNGGAVDRRTPRPRRPPARFRGRRGAGTARRRRRRRAPRGTVPSLRRCTWSTATRPRSRRDAARPRPTPHLSRRAGRQHNDTGKDRRLGPAGRATATRTLRHEHEGLEGQLRVAGRHVRDVGAADETTTVDGPVHSHLKRGAATGPRPGAGTHVEDLDVNLDLVAALYDVRRAYPGTSLHTSLHTQLGRSLHTRVLLFVSSSATSVACL